MRMKTGKKTNENEIPNVGKRVSSFSLIIIIIISQTKISEWHSQFWNSIMNNLNFTPPFFVCLPITVRAYSSLRVSSSSRLSSTWCGLMLLMMKMRVRARDDNSWKRRWERGSANFISDVCFYFSHSGSALNCSGIHFNEISSFNDFDWVFLLGSNASK